jgi:hypothetical protein
MIYMNQEAVEDTLRKIGGTARGSVVAFEYFTTEPLESERCIGPTGERRRALASRSSSGSTGRCQRASACLSCFDLAD